VPEFGSPHQRISAAASVFAIASCAKQALARVSGLIHTYRHDRARRHIIRSVPRERGIVGTCAGRAKARGDGDLAVGVGGVGGVVVADAVKVVVDSNGLRREGRSTATQGGVEGDGLVDDGSGVGRGEGKMGGVAAQRRCDVDSDDAARRCLIRAVTGERGIVGAYSGGGPLGCEGER